MPKFDELTGRWHRTVGDTEPEPRDRYEEPDDIKPYADALDLMTSEELADHQRALNVVRELEEMEREGLL